MRKEDLKDGMVIEDRRGEKSLVFGDRLLDYGGYNPLEILDDSLKDNKDRFSDVVKVYKARGGARRLDCIFEEDCLDLIWERKEYPVLTEVQHGFLKELLDNEFLTICKNEDAALKVYKTKNQGKGIRKDKWGKWTSIYDCDSVTNEICTSTFKVPFDLFPFIKWTDEEPWSIQELLENCEVEK